MIANLNNPIFFYKAFSDKIVFSQFVNDVLAVKFRPGVIKISDEIELKTGYTHRHQTIYSESEDKRVVIIVHKIDHDFKYASFLFNYIATIMDLPFNTAKKIELNDPDLNIYSIVIVTSPYQIMKKNGITINDEMLALKLKVQNICDQGEDFIENKVIILNINYQNSVLSANAQNWLKLIHESMHNSEQTTIYFSNPGIQRAISLLKYENISSQDWQQSRELEAKQKARLIYEEMSRSEGIIEGRKEERKRGIIKALQRGKLSFAEIAEDYNVNLETIQIIEKKIRRKVAI